MRFLCAALSLLLLAACQQTGDGPVTEAARDGHVLTGTLWLPGKGVETDWDTVTAMIRDARFVLAGEKHDNLHHHKVQARIVRLMAGEGRRPALVWEMIPASKRGALNAYQDLGTANADGLGDALGWTESGWPGWEDYRPIAEAAFDAGLKHHPGNLDKADIRRVASEGFLVLPDITARTLIRNAVWTPEDNDALTRDLIDSHCGVMPGEMMRPMARVQRSRDAVMAAALLEADVGDGAILIAGNGHVRGDRGVKRYLSPEKRVLSIGILEVLEGATGPAAYMDHPNQYDIMIFTPKVETPDRCAALRKRFGKKKQG